MADEDGFQEVKNRHGRRRKKVNRDQDKSNVNTDNGESRDKTSSDTELVHDENNPGPSSSPVASTNENMGRGSHSEDTSDVDSVEFERQNQELEDLERQIEQEKAKRSVKEKRERKNKMVEMRRIAEERRKELERIRSRNSDSDGVSPPKKPRTESPARKVSKTKNGKGVKSSKKVRGKAKNDHDKSISTNKKLNKQDKKKRTKKMNKHRKRTSSSSSESSSDSSVLDEFEETISRAKQKGEQKTEKIKRKLKSKRILIERHSSRGESSEGSTGSSVDSSTDSESSRNQSSSYSEEERRRSKKGKRKHKKRGKSIRSGVKAKAHKIRLKTSELCAQAVLDEEHYPGTYSLEELSFDQLVAGELEICTLPDISKREKLARLKILKSLAYFSQTLNQSAILEVYKAVILKVEKGLFTWSPELVAKTEQMLDRAVSKNNWKKEKERNKEHTEKEKPEKRVKKELGIPLKNGDRIVYCADYNKNRCDKEPSHEGKFGGKDCVKHHVCRICLTNDKEKRYHPETDEKCPCKNR